MRQRGAVLAASIVLLSCLWPTPAAAAAENLFLRGDGEPKATMSSASPPSRSLPDYDGDGPGRLVQKDAGGAQQNDSSKYQQWSFDVSGQTISVLNLKIWAAAKDFDGDKHVKFRAYLLDCGGSCVLIQQSDVATVKSSDWKLVTVPFNATNISFDSGRSLVVKITVVDGSDDDMWFAYGTSTFDAHLKVNLDSLPPTTTSTSTTTTTTTTTTSPTTTSTTQPATTTTRPRDSNAPSAQGAAGPSTGQTTTTQVETPVTTTAGIDVEAARGNVDHGGAGEDSGEAAGPVDVPRPRNESDHELTPVLSSAANHTRVAALFETSRDLQPAEGLMVAFATAAETIALYWQAAVGLGSLAAVLVWRGLATDRDWEPGDESAQQPLSHK